MDLFLLSNSKTPIVFYAADLLKIPCEPWLSWLMYRERARFLFAMLHRLDNCFELGLIWALLQEGTITALKACFFKFSTLTSKAPELVN